MIDLINVVRSKLKETLSEVYYLRNHKVNVEYPYLTFSYTSDPDRQYSDRFYIDIDVFDDKGMDNERIETVVGKLNRITDLPTNYEYVDGHLIQYESIKFNNIPTGSDTLQRRNAQLIIRIEWRK